MFVTVGKEADRRRRKPEEGREGKKRKSKRGKREKKSPKTGGRSGGGACGEWPAVPRPKLPEMNWNYTAWSGRALIGCGGGFRHRGSFIGRSFWEWGRFRGPSWYFQPMECCLASDRVGLVVFLCFCCFCWFCCFSWLPYAMPILGYRRSLLGASHWTTMHPGVSVGSGESKTAQRCWQPDQEWWRDYRILFR